MPLKAESQLRTQRLSHLGLAGYWASASLLLGMIRRRGWHLSVLLCLGLRGFWDYVGGGG